MVLLSSLPNSVQPLLIIVHFKFQVRYIVTPPPLPAPGRVTQWLMLVNIVSSGENIDSGLFPDRENIPEAALETANWPIIIQESDS